MTLRGVAWRGLRHYWQTSLLVIVGLAIAGAVVTGSLVVGDSMRGSLRDTALERLGKVDYALAPPRALAAEGLAGKLRNNPRVRQVVGVTKLTGSATNTTSEAAAPDVTIWLIPDDFWKLIPAVDSAAVAGNGTGAAVNAALARDLGLSQGDEVLLTAARPAEMGSGSLFTRRGLQEAVSFQRWPVTAVLGDHAGDFRLEAQTAQPRNIFIPLSSLTSDGPAPENTINTLLVESDGSPHAGTELQQALGQAVSLDDYGLSVQRARGSGRLAVFSQDVTFSDDQVKAVREAAQEAGAACSAASIYVATTVRNQSLGREAAYVLLLGMEGVENPQLQEWAAQDLQAKVGQALDIEYPLPQPDGTLQTLREQVTVGSLARLKGPLADDTLVPRIAGVTDSLELRDWKPPFPVDMSRITQRDEDWWHAHRATPKMLLPIDAVKRMWQSGPGGADAEWVTSIEIGCPAGREVLVATELERSIPTHLNPAQAGLVFRPVREQALAAAKGTSDFASLFLGLSMFLVMSGAGLSGMLLRLGLERRSSQLGLMLALGLDERQVRRVVMSEGAALTVAGSVLGVPVGIAYAGLMLWLLNHQWQGALGAMPRLWLHVTPLSVLVGLVGAAVVGIVAAAWGLKGMLRATPLSLLRGQSGDRPSFTNETIRKAPDERTKMGPGLPLPSAATAPWVLVLVTLTVALLVTVASRLGPTAFFFAAGVALLIGGLLVGRNLMQGALRRRWRGRSLGALALRNMAANPRRSLLVVGLLAGATFVVVAVAANARDVLRADPRHSPATGGFSLRAVSAAPLAYDLSTPPGRENLGFSAEDEAIMARCVVMPFFVSPGEDVSCLNLSRPQSPRLLGVTDAMVKRDGFRLSGSKAWTALAGSPSPIVPAFGDADTVRWTLHSAPGKVYETHDAHGRPLQLEFVGLIHGGLFARELLIHETAFRRLYPSVGGYSYFLIQTPAGQEQAAVEVLRRNLGDYGLQVRTTAEAIAEVMSVQNTYLSIFLALGGLGLLLGTVGLVAVIVRGALERRQELALLLATGFDELRVARLLMMEHGGLLVAGVVLGTVAALLAVAPQLVSAQAAVNWTALLTVLAGVLVTGLMSCVFGVRMSLRGPLLAALRSE
ncbi:MAG: FtsX-like permease family protein [Armatimonadia bacterium]